jgi:hypothetical protein
MPPLWLLSFLSKVKGYIYNNNNKFILSPVATKPSRNKLTQTGGKCDPATNNDISIPVKEAPRGPFGVTIR